MVSRAPLGLSKGLAEDRAKFTLLLTAYIVIDEVSNGSKVYDLE